jgi:hypothetical protein
MKKLKKKIEKLVDFKFNYDAKNPYLLFKLGSREHGWIPGKRHFLNVAKQIKKMRLDKKFNIILTMFAVEVNHIN